MTIFNLLGLLLHIHAIDLKDSQKIKKEDLNFELQSLHRHIDEIG